MLNKQNNDFMRITIALLLSFFSITTLFAVGVQHVNASQFNALIKTGEGVILDVRTQGEYSRGHIENATLISTSDRDFVKKVSLLQKDKPLYVYCLTGSRSYAVVNYLFKQGYTRLYNLSRGTMEWQNAGFKLVKSTQVTASTSKKYSTQEFANIVQQNGLTLVDFHAPWCAPCKKVLPIVKQADTDFGKQVQLVTLDIEANESLKNQYRVISIPGIVLFKNGTEVWRHTGTITQDELYSTIKAHL